MRCQILLIIAVALFVNAAPAYARNGNGLSSHEVGKRWGAKRRLALGNKLTEMTAREGYSAINRWDTRQRGAVISAAVKKAPRGTLKLLEGALALGKSAVERIGSDDKKIVVQGPHHTISLMETGGLKVEKRTIRSVGNDPGAAANYKDVARGIDRRLKSSSEKGKAFLAFLKGTLDGDSYDPLVSRLSKVKTSGGFFDAKISSIRINNNNGKFELVGSLIHPDMNVKNGGEMRWSLDGRALMEIPNFANKSQGLNLVPQISRD